MNQPPIDSSYQTGFPPTGPGAVPGHGAPPPLPGMAAGHPPPPPPPIWSAPTGGGPLYPPPPPPKARTPRGRIILGVVLALAVVGYAAINILGGRLSGAAARSPVEADLRAARADIAQINIEGPIMPGPDYDFWMAALEAAANDAHVKGVLLRLDSPGGSVGASQEIYDLLHEIRASGKPVFVSMGDLAASGGYYIASAADYIVANRGTLTGSIGVISTMYQVSELAQKAGVDVKVVKTGRFKDSGSMFRAMDPAEEKMFASLLDDAYGQFVADILRERKPRLEAALGAMTEERWKNYQFGQRKPEAAPAAPAPAADDATPDEPTSAEPRTESRPKGSPAQGESTKPAPPPPPAESAPAPEAASAAKSVQVLGPKDVDADGFLREIGDGRVYTGAQALELGLVDQLGSLRVATELLADKLGVGDEYSVYQVRRRITFLEAISASVQNIAPRALTHPTLEYRAAH